MPIKDSIPEIWAKVILSELRHQFVYAQGGVINTNYQGLITQHGDTVHITTIADPQITPYDKDVDIEYGDIDDDKLTLLIDQGDSFGFKANDIDVVQSAVDFVSEASRGAGIGLMGATDKFVAMTMKASVAAANQLAPLTLDSPGKAFSMLVNLRGALTKSNVPDAGRWVIVPTDVYGMLLLDEKFISTEKAGTSTGLRNGQVGRAAGFDILESQTVPKAGDVYTVIAGYSGATTFANQIVKVESGRMEKRFANWYRGLHVYGGKVIRPTGLASCDVKVA